MGSLHSLNGVYRLISTAGFLQPEKSGLLQSNIEKIHFSGSDLPLAPPIFTKSKRSDFSPDSWFQYMNIRNITENSIYRTDDLAMCSKTDERDIRVYIPSILYRMKTPSLTAFFRQQLADMLPTDKRDITDLLTLKKPWKTKIYLEKSESGQASLRMHYTFEQSIQNLRIPFDLNDKNGLQEPAEDLNLPGSNRAQFYPDDKTASDSTAYVEAYLLPNPQTGSKAGEVAQVGVCDLKKTFAEAGKMAYELSGYLFDYLEQQLKKGKKNEIPGV